MAELRQGLADLLRGEELTQFSARRQRFEAAGLPAALATRIAMLDALTPAFDLVELARERRTSITRVATLHAMLGSELGIDWLRHRALALTATGPWQGIAREALVEASWQLQRQFTAQVLRGRGSDAQRLARLLAARPDALRNWQGQLAQLRATPNLDFAALSVGLESVRRLAGR
jgi:glutamate dehydrogenase